MKTKRPILGFDRRLADTIFKSNMELNEICRKAGISRSNLWSYLYSGVTPSANNVIGLSKALNVTTDYLLKGDK